MHEYKQPIVDEDEMPDANLDQVSGGNTKPIVKPKPKPTTTVNGGGLNSYDGVKGESSDGRHKGEIELLS